MSYVKKDLREDLWNKMIGPVPEDNFESDGCTNSPDAFGGVDLRTACHFHDYHYSLGKTEKDRKRADRLLHANLRSCDLSKFKAGIYYRRVRLWGNQFFNYAEGEAPKNKLFYRCKLFFTRWF